MYCKITYLGIFISHFAVLNSYENPTHNFEKKFQTSIVTIFQDECQNDEPLKDLKQ
jgi:hypothetical protein